MLTLTAQTFCEDSACERSRGQPRERCASHKAPKPQVFGSAYTCAIADSVTEGGPTSTSWTQKAKSCCRHTCSTTFPCHRHGNGHMVT